MAEKIEEEKNINRGIIQQIRLERVIIMAQKHLLMAA